jgi:cytochrome c oxidase assembly protein subunit 15
MQKDISIWLACCCLMVLMMVLIGGYTRLTHSGLSIVEWKPITGTVPPIGESAWLQEFAKYKATPEYRQINYNITLPQFKSIFLIEYTHRLAGRIAGLVFFLPFCYFIIKKRLTSQTIYKLCGIFLLGAIQGGIGWYMVKSGLSTQPHVSHYRLALHLLTATIIYCLIFWQFLNNMTPRLKVKDNFLCNYINLVLFLLLLQISYGGLVAGLKAGLIYNQFPLMGTGLIPQEIWHYTPWYRNLFDNAALVQLIHRIIAYIIVLAIILLLCYRNLSTSLRNGFYFALIAVLLQFGLGVITLLQAVPLVPALLHQFNALILLSAVLFIKHNLVGSYNGLRKTLSASDHTDQE